MCAASSSRATSLGVRSSMPHGPNASRVAQTEDRRVWLIREGRREPPDAPRRSLRRSGGSDQGLPECPARLHRDALGHLSAASPSRRIRPQTRCQRPIRVLRGKDSRPLGQCLRITAQPARAHDENGRALHETGTERMCERRAPFGSYACRLVSSVRQRSTRARAAPPYEWRRPAVGKMIGSCSVCTRAASRA